MIKSNSESGFRNDCRFVQRLGNEKIQDVYLTWIVAVLKDVLEQIDEAIRLAFQKKLQIEIELASRAAATIRKTTDKRIQLTFDCG